MTLTIARTTRSIISQTYCRRLTRTMSSSSSSNNKLYSQRGQDAVKLLPSYLADARNVKPYCAVNNPDGALQLGVAESKILEDLLVPMLNSNPPIDSGCIYYQPTAGRESFRAAMAAYMEKLLKLEANSLDRNGLVVGAGCNAVLENLCLVLTQPGDTVLIPTPYYAAFEFDLVARIGLNIQAVNTVEYSKNNSNVEQYYPTRAALDAACEKSATPPRILLLSHPHNPLGVCYPPEVMQECIDWCREREIHLINDEIYAGSVYRDANFKSALEICAKDGLGPFIHWVYAFSKDFALSGLRIGAAYTENTDIQLPLQKLNDLCQISSTTQVLAEHLLTCNNDQGENWVEAFRNENYKRLDARATKLTKCLDECKFPYLAPVSGLFCWIDFSQFLDKSGDNNKDIDAQERELYLKLIHDFGLLLTPGRSMHCEKPGFFRCVFTAASDDEFEIALGRINKFAQAMQK